MCCDEAIRILLRVITNLLQTMGELRPAKVGDEALEANRIVLLYCGEAKQIFYI